MSEDKKGLGEFVQRMSAGLNRIKSSAQTKPAPTEPTLTADLADSPMGDRDHNANTALDHDDLLAEQTPQNPAEDTGKKKRAGVLSGMSTSKKILLVAVIMIAVVIGKNSAFRPSSSHTNANNGQVEAKESTNPDLAFRSIGDKKAQPSQDLDAPLPSPLGEQLHTDDAVGKPLDQLNVDGPYQVKAKSDGQHASTTVASAQGPVDALGFPAATTPSTSAPLDSVRGSTPTPLTGQPAITSEPQTPAFGTPEGKAESNPFGQPKTPTGLGVNLDQGLSAASAPGKSDPILGGAPSRNPDSCTQPNLQGNTGKELADLRADLNAKDEKIQGLEKQLKLAKLEQPIKAPHKPTIPRASTHIKHSNAVVQRSIPKPTIVAKVSPRPKVCVKAVAPAARNCPSCVAHAFIVDAGEETMVGHGDNLHGYRVSIAGDRLDLQSSDGQIVHKFWSQQNGCPSI